MLAICREIYGVMHMYFKKVIQLKDLSSTFSEKEEKGQSKLQMVGGKKQ